MKTGRAPCYCGHSIEEHMEFGGNGGRSPACAADGCECMQYEEDGDTQRDLDPYYEGSREEYSQKG